MAEKDPIVSFKNAHEIGRHFYNIQQQDESENTTTSIYRENSAAKAEGKRK